MTELGDLLIEAMGEAKAHARGELELTEHPVEIPEELDVRKIRSQTGLSQDDFAKRYGFSVSTLRKWEQGQRTPDRSARILLLMIGDIPKVVDRYLQRHRVKQSSQKDDAAGE